MAKYIVKSVTATFGSVTYKLKSVPPSPEKTAEPVDVTTLDDTHVQRLPGSLIEDGDITLVVQGLNEAPTSNTTGALSLSLSISDGSTDTSKTVSCGVCILKNVSSKEVEANNAREFVHTLVFAPTGGALPTPSGNT